MRLVLSQHTDAEPKAGLLSSGGRASCDHTIGCYGAASVDVFRRRGTLAAGADRIHSGGVKNRPVQQAHQIAEIAAGACGLCRVRGDRNREVSVCMGGDDLAAIPARKRIARG
jgi:hypothetical protein